MRVRLRFRENGPFVLDLPEGTRFTLNGEDRVLERPKLALCRCGHSSTKPLCDGSHKRVGFTAAAGAIELDLPS
ncbi:Iron sulfur domain-containing, CDGSH-type [Marinithermus hydrothermalis DSM 14884]|uniref:Iron sulfur domain-containing, CDGSH-type n=1 Tax=Marinithermus hydrothermalis (strain DSM 14884 / JCM 11576 / T1) TaxID=869210 RepID=F2NKM7_MARHT|nr:Iron sulfur domain-containing, CDGSH-type [Marinithermus hydrothermalis DSM 14884]